MICEGGDAPELEALVTTAKRHNAQIRNQYEAFAEFVSEAEAAGETQSALYKWAKVTIDDPVKAAKHKKIVTFYVNGDSVYGKMPPRPWRRTFCRWSAGRWWSRSTSHESQPGQQSATAGAFDVVIRLSRERRQRFYNCEHTS